MVPQAAGVVGGGNEAAAQGVHFRQGAYPTGVAEIVAEPASGQTGAGGGLHGDDLIPGLAPEHFPHKGGDESPQIGPASGAADDYVRMHAVFIQGQLCLQTNDALVQQHLVEHAAQHIAVVLSAGGVFHCLADGAAQRAGGLRKPAQDIPAHLGGIRGGGGDAGTVGTHDLPAEGLLLIGALYHEHTAVKPQVGAGHAQGRAPLAGSRLRGDAAQTLLFGVISLGDGGIELVGAGGVAALELVVDLCRSPELFLQTIGPNQRGGTVHPVKITDLPGDFNIGCPVVQLLDCQLPAEHLLQLRLGHGTQSGGVQQRRGLRLHIGPNIVPIPGHFLLGEVDLVGDVLHAVYSFQKIKNACPTESSPWDRLLVNIKTCGTTHIGAKAPTLRAPSCAPPG